MKKSSKKMWNRLSRLVLAIVTLVTIILVTCWIASFGAKIIKTQVRMAHYHSEIEKLEADRDYCLEVVATSQIAEQRAAYQKQADNDDEAIQNCFEARENLHESSDAVIRFAAKNDFDILICLLAIAMFGIAVAFLVIAYQIFFEKVVNVEKAIVDFIFRHVFLILYRIFGSIATIMLQISDIF